MAPWVISHFPRHKVYVEPFGGAGSVLIRKPRSYAEVYNDLCGDVVNLFRILQDPTHAKELDRMLRLTPFARAEFDLAYQFDSRPLEQARRLIIRSYMGFGSDGHTIESGKTGFRSNSNRSGTTPAHDWANFPSVIPAFCERLSGVVIENRDAKDVMLQHDSDQTLHYVDPPYVHATRGTKHGYNFEMTNDEHEELLFFLKSLKGFVIVSGYQNKLYEKLGWHFVSIQSLADGARPRNEVLWMNDLTWKHQKQLSLF